MRGGRGHALEGAAIAKSFAYAWAGLTYLYETQRTMRLHLLIGSLVGAACIVLGVGREEVLMVALAIAGVLLSEVVNTVVEGLTDLMEPRLDPVAKLIKDVAAAGVLLSAGFSVLIGALVFYPTVSSLPARLEGFLDRRTIPFAVYVAFVVIPAAAGLARPVKRAWPPIPDEPGSRPRTGTR